MSVTQYLLIFAFRIADYAALPGARLVPVDLTSHFIMLDRPELVQAKIVRGAQR